MINIHNLRVHGLALEAFAVVNEALDTVPGRSGHGYLVTQCRRSVSSAVSNIAEGAGRAGWDRAHFFQIAYGSAAEPAGWASKHEGGAGIAACVTRRRPAQGRPLPEEQEGE